MGFIDVLSKIWPLILAGLGAILWFINSWQKGKIRGQQRTIKELKNAEKAYQAKEEIHRQDDVINQQADTQIEDFREKVQQTETPEDKSEVIVDALDDYFNEEDK